MQQDVHHNIDENILMQITQKPVTYHQAVPDILLLEFPFVNAFMVGSPNSKGGEWALVGAGMAHTGRDIIYAAEQRFGMGLQPKAIILTHGHFDHVGAILELLDRWNVPAYAHPLELPYLTGTMDYPPADPTVNDGLIAKISPTFPNKGINLGNRVGPLPSDGSVPGMSGWRWIHTPGHSPGHVALFRDSDRVLISGDAITTLKQDSAQSVLSREAKVCGPPAYFTIDWKEAENSVKVLRDLKPKMIISSHGLPMQGKEAAEQLNNLADNFSRLAVPQNKRFVH